MAFERVKSNARKKSRERFLSKLPDGAIRLPSTVPPLIDSGFQDPSLRDEVTAETIKLKEKFGFTRLFLVHGCAFEKNGAAVIVAGPPGIGKSSLMRQQCKMGQAKPIADGFVLVGQTARKMVLFKAQPYFPQQRISLISKLIRSAAAYKSPFLDEGNPRLFRLRAGIGQAIAYASLVVGRELTPPMRGKKFTPTTKPLDKMILVQHPRNPYRVIELREDGVEAIPEGDLPSVFKYTAFHLTTTSKRAWTKLV